MEPEFWHQRWQKNEIGFHESQVNPLLVSHLPALELKPGARIFLPLCGKTLDIAWLLEQGYQVVGVELSQLAIDALFQSLDLVPTVINLGPLQHYSALNIDIFAGDIFALTPELLGTVTATYDRAALVALPTALRERYAAHLAQLTGHAPVLQITFAYNQAQMDGPPFSVSEAELARLYTGHYQRIALASKLVPGGLRGKTPAIEAAWLLLPC